MTTTIWPGQWTPEVRPVRPVVESLDESAFAERYERLATIWDRTLAWRVDAQIQAHLATSGGYTRSRFRCR